MVIQRRFEGRWKRADKMCEPAQRLYAKRPWLSKVNLIYKLLVIAALFLSACEFDRAGSFTAKMSFWNDMKRGANIFHNRILPEDVKAAKGHGIQFVRIALDKFPSKRRDFLIGDADNYTAIDPDDLRILNSTLDMFDKEGLPVVVTMLSLPGSRWKQLNGGKDDLRIWTSEKYQKQAVKFWKDLAKALRNYRIVVGYNILNEPHPERIFNSTSCHVEEIEQDKVQKLLFDFNSMIVQWIREEDAETPIIIDSSGYADPNTFEKLRPISDSSVIYSFHMYEPYEYTNHKLNKSKYVYPGKIAGKHLDVEGLRTYMSAIGKFQTRYGIQSNRILVGEFGCYRKQQGIDRYFDDLIKIFEENHWHWAFYAFRDDWDGMDYELGDKSLPWEYWKAKDRGEEYALKRTPDSRSFKSIHRALSQ
jgi:aryl-phospho-beta-D-glucosidase BglC (GH1 family)